MNLISSTLVFSWHLPISWQPLLVVRFLYHTLHLYWSSLPSTLVSWHTQYHHLRSLNYTSSGLITTITCCPYCILILHFMPSLQLLYIRSSRHGIMQSVFMSSSNSKPVGIIAQEKGDWRKRNSKRARNRDLCSNAEFQPHKSQSSSHYFISHRPICASHRCATDCDRYYR